MSGGTSAGSSTVGRVTTGTSTALTTIALTCLPVVSYAMAHNRIPVVDEVAVTADRDAEGAVLELAVVDAEGVLSSTCTHVVDLAAGDRTVVADVGLTLDPAQMLQVDEQRPGRVTATLRLGDETLATASSDVRVLAARQWLAVPPELSMEMLAAFVMPHDPAIGPLLDEVSALLRERTGSTALQGYQAGPERVDDVVRAVFDAARARGIRYAEPPASWGDVGQRVRTPTQVLDERVGTCLDTVVALAAVLEQCGVRPLLWMVRGHAFLGYWREETSLANIVLTDVSPVVNLLDLGAIRLVETTMVTSSEPAHDVDAAHRSAYARWLTGDLDDVLGVVDVWTARRSDVLPLPARTRTPSGEVQVVLYQAASHSTAPRAADEPAAQVRTSTTPAPPRVARWKNALLDLSLRNRLINFTDRSAVTLTVPDGRSATLPTLLGRGRPLHLYPSDALDDVHVARGITSARQLPPDLLAQTLDDREAVWTDVTGAAYPTLMRALAHRARTAQEETGANNLYLALGSLVWDWDGRTLRSPVVLVPVHLVARARQRTYRLEQDETGSPAPNYCLLEKLRQAGVEVPELLPEGGPLDLDAALRTLRVAVAEAGRPWRVEDTAHVAILQFAKFRLWKDLDESWESFCQNALVRHLVHSPTDPFADVVPADDGPVDLDELSGACPVPADASQLTAVHDAVRGRSFVLEGPPGTGKSQTITNLLSRAVAEGRRVLFVAEKRAALDVVQKRLDAVGMGPFSLDLHDKGSRPATVRAQVRRALEHSPLVDEQGLHARQEELRASRRTLERYAHRLHSPNAAGLSLYSARDALLASGEGPTLTVPRSLLGAAGDLTSVRDLLRTLPDVADPARPRPAHPWGFAGAQVDAARARAAALALHGLVQQLPQTGADAEVVRTVGSARELELLGRLGTLGLRTDELDRTRTGAWRAEADVLLAEVRTLARQSHPALAPFLPRVLSAPQLPGLAAQARDAASSFFLGRKGRLRKVLVHVEPDVHGGVDVDLRALPDLLAALLPLRETNEALRTRVQALPGIRVASTWNAYAPDALDELDRAVRLADEGGRAVAPEHPAAGPRRAWLDAGAAWEWGGRTLHLVEELFAATDAHPDDVAHWAGGSLVDAWEEGRDGRDLDDPQLMGLRRWAAFSQALEPLRAALGEARLELRDGRVPADEAVQALDRGLAQASALERAADSGLDGFDPLTHERTIARFLGSATAVRDLMVDELARQVVRARPFRADTATGRVGALQRELGRQRGGLGVRALMQQYGDLITQVMPCVLVSPDSLSRFFPARAGLFDLVVFDEASQIRVADAVGAMGRARSVVVVGDSKQMPPTSFAEVTGESVLDTQLSSQAPGLGADDEAAFDASLLAVEDEESILTECVQARVPRHWLSWHYRSQDESLIAFSNRHYYEDRLASFPGPRSGNVTAAAGFGLSLVRVDGTFLRSGKGRQLRTNPVEAQALVAEIRRRFDASPDVAPSIGVVTFNAPQRLLVESLLRDAGDDRLVEALEDPDGLFVKNLENVQGDERDTILFSTAFSVNDKGVLPLNFGPLNLVGGERRLNVAVTRARRQVVVFSSFDPAQLRADETTSVGIKHLRAYLDLAAGSAEDGGGRIGAPPVVDRHRDEVAAQLRAAGLVVRTDVGLSDFRVELTLAAPGEPARPLVAVLLDGPGWARRRTVGDRDGLPVEVLSRMLGWPAVERVWLPAWLRDPDAVVAELVARVEAVGSGQDTGDLPDVHVETLPMVKAAPPAPVVALPDAQAAGELPGARAFVPWTPTTVGSRRTLDALPEPEAARRVREAAVQIIDVEGPVARTRLIRLVAAAFDLSRVSAARASAIAACLPTGVDDENGFYWPPHRSRDRWAGFRRAGAELRPLDEVSLEEIGNAMRGLCRAGMGMSREELLRETVAVFGGKRVTPAIRTRAEQALTHAVGAGRLAVDAGTVHAT